MIIEHKTLGMVQICIGFSWGMIRIQLSFSDVEYAAKHKKTKREIFLVEMGRVKRGQVHLL